MPLPFKQTTTPFLLKLHGAIREALAHDRSRSAGDVYYGVEQFPDWRQEADALEEELSDRQVHFEPIPW